LCTVSALTACIGDSDDGALSGVVVAPPPAVSPQDNVNIPDPTLVLFDNEPVGPGDELIQVWEEEFDGERVDPETWFFQSGDGTDEGIPGWGNNELQYYLPDNAQVSDGMLTITAREESTGGFNYTSARIITRDRVAVRYGRIEARIRLPGGQGIWPAFWMLPQDTSYGGWAASGEIDIVEAVNLGGSGGNEVFGTLHYGGEAPANVFTGEAYVVPADARAEFHTYSIEWDPTEIRWYVDGVLYAMQNSWFSTAAPFPAPFDQPFYIILNVAVGGNFPGPPNAITAFPVTMDVDWIRVYAGQP